MKPIYIQMDKALFIPGIGDLGKKTINQTFFPGVKMELHPYGVVVDWKEHSFLVPWAKIEACGVTKEKKNKDAKEAA